MDLLIEKGDLTMQLSEYGLLIKDVAAPMPKMNVMRNDINFKNGTLFYGKTDTEKEITVSASYYADDEYEDLLVQDKLNGLFGSREPFFITRMYSIGNLYEFERPGVSNKEDANIIENHFAYRYRWRVILSDVIDYEFQGRTPRGLLTNVTIKFVTSDIPYGMTVPEDIDLSKSAFISYLGTTSCSQLDYPFYFELTADQDQNAGFALSVGEREFVYNGTNQIKKGDVFKLKGTSFLLNELNINDKTNIEYFVLQPSTQNTNRFVTNFKGTIVLKNKVDFYL